MIFSRHSRKAPNDTRVWRLLTFTLAIITVILIAYPKAHRPESELRPWEHSQGTIVIIGRDGPSMERTISSLMKCGFSSQKISLDLQLLSDEAREHLEGYVPWPEELVRINRARNVFEAVLDASARAASLRNWKLAFMREGCRLCFCHMFTEIDEVLSSFDPKERTVGIAMEPAPNTRDNVFASIVSPACVYFPISQQLWLGFTKYLEGARNEWFYWPGKDSYHPTDWALWLGRFSHVHNIYTLYLSTWGASKERDQCRLEGGLLSSISMDASAPIPKLNLTFDDIQQNSRSIDVNDKEVEELADYAHKQGSYVAVTVVNKVFLTTARSWLCNVEYLKIKPPGIIWIATDEVAYNALSKVDGTRAVLFGMKGGKETGNAYGQPGYWRLMLERTILFRKVLERGVAIFAFETDQIWLRDPLPYILELVRDGADIVGTLDSRNEIGGNLLYMVPSPPFVKLWGEVADRFHGKYSGANFQKKSATSNTYIPNDQSILTTLVLYDWEFKVRFPVVLRILNTQLFVDGRFYENYYTSKESKSPVLINNNFVIGVDKKIERAKRVGHWFYDEKGDTCLNNVLRKATKESSNQINEPLDQHRNLFLPDYLSALTK